MARRLLPALAPALLALAPAAQATVSQTPEVADTRYASVLHGEQPVVTGVSIPAPMTAGSGWGCPAGSRLASRPPPTG